MKIGILTFHGADNYGSVMQTYASKTFIESIADCECEVVNYIPPNQEDLYAVYLPNNSIKNIVKNLRATIVAKLLKNRTKTFASFRQNKLKVISNKIYSEKDLYSYLKKFDTVVCGSDQIWNPLSVDFTLAYYLPEYNGKKVSYAPSFGNGKADDFASIQIDKRDIGEYLNRFDAISVREISGTQVCNDLGVSKPVSVVLDPTLLLSKNEWDKIAGEKIDEKYIFFYSINYNPQAIEIVRKIAAETGLKVKYMFTTNKAYSMFGKGMELVSDTRPENFLALIKNAELVLSNSFHGTAFSVIYRKKFFSIEVEVDGKAYIDERIHTILSSIGNENRIIDANSYKSIDWKNIPPVDYSEEKIEKLISSSKSFLRDALLRGEKNE